MKKSLLIVFLLTILSTIYPQKQLTVEEIYSNRKLYGKSLTEVKWISNSSDYTFLKYNADTKSVNLVKHNAATGVETIIVDQKNLQVKGEEEFQIENYILSPDDNNILFTGVLPARDVKSGGTFYLYSQKDKTIKVLAKSDKEQENAIFSPDGKKLGFVRGNNVFVVDVLTGKEKQLTTDGSKNIINGAFDWVYEEEFSIINGLEWSSDSKSLAYWKLDQTRVPEFKIAKWDSLHLNFLDMKYPKAGDPNSIVKIGVVNVENGKNVFMNIGTEEDIYIPRIKFTNDPNLLMVERMNRLQNKIDFLMCNIKTGAANTILTDTDPAWIDAENNSLYFFKKQKQFLFTSQKDGYRHLYLYDYSGKLLNQVTKGEWEVKELVSVDENKNIVYYTSNERGIIYMDLYGINTNGSGKKLLTAKPGYHSVIPSSDNNYFIDKYNTANSTSDINIINTTGTKVAELIKADTTINQEYGLNRIEFIQFTTSDGVVLNASILKPANFDPLKKYPVLFNNYSGPGSQIVIDRFEGPDYYFHQMLSQKGYIIFMVDNRGTGGRGRAFEKMTYKNLGKWEINDLVEGAKYLSSLPYVDKDRIGIWGWSYGGYIAALAITKAADYFKTAVAVAPVIKWDFYDTIYGERFMQTPKLNPEGFKESSPLNYIDRYKGKLLLIHGTADDNVHFQNSVALVNAMIENNKQLDVMYYPEKDHGIYGGMTRIHLFNKITNFILNNL